ncbi:MAG: hypothetical protein CVV27_08550, partial [Candidatus Melainabacteria bacterium HGW-Melainabacteria-1]
MPAFLRSILITLGVTLFTFLALSGWYWLQFKQPAPEYQRLLKRALPAVEQLLDANQFEQASALLDKLPFQVVLADSGRQAMTSNLAKTENERRTAGQRALDRQLLPSMLPSDSGELHLYYQLPANWLDLHLLFPLFFGLLLGLVAALWDFLQQIHLEDQTDTLILLSQRPDLPKDQEGHALEAAHASAHEAEEHLQARIETLEQQNKSLQAALHKAKQWAPEAPAADPRAQDSQIHKLEQQLGERDAALTLARQAEKRLNEQRAELEARLQGFKQQLGERESENRALKQKETDQEAELTRLHQTLQRQQRDLETARSRIDELEAQAAQLHEAWREIAQLRTAQAELLQREEIWKKEKQRVLALMHEKEEALEQGKEKLKAARQKIHELSVAYKKQLEMAQYLPEDLSDARDVMGTLIEEKDRIEHENVQLQIELADRNSETARLRKELEVRALRLQEAQKLIEDLSEALRKHERELGLLSETLSDKLKDLDRLKDLHDEKVQVLEETMQDRDRLRLRLSELQNEVEALREDKGRLLYAREQLEEQLQGIDVAAYQLELEQLRQSLQLMGQQQQRRSQAVEELKSKLKQGEELYMRLKRHADAQEQ